jgi:outer membrane protein OmpA-like peptidoglycan-associated protein
MNTVSHRTYVLALTVALAVLLLSGAIEAQLPSTLRESTRDDQTSTRKLVEVERSAITVKVWMDKPCGSPYDVGEKALIYFSADADGYVTLYDIDPQGNVLIIFPNRHTPDNFVRAGQTFQLPAVDATYDLIVEGPEGVEYIEAVASTNPYYRWDHRQGQPRWLQEWNIERKSTDGLEVRAMDQETLAAYRQSDEYQNLPQGLGALGLQSLEKNFQISRGLREQVQSKLVVTERESGQPQQPTPRPQSSSSGSSSGGSGQAQPISTETAVKNYSTASCYFYVVAQRPAGATAQPSAYLPGEYLRQQAQDFQRVQGLAVENYQDRLLLEMPGGILFDSGSYMLKAQAQRALNQVADILLTYPQTDIVVSGHTDSIGRDDYNRLLSESRARTVSDYLISRGVQQYRISWLGYGKTLPIASNDTELGRQRNRRVELEIRVNPRYQP